MKNYLVSVMAFCSMCMAISIFTFASGLLSVLSPEASLSSSVFSKYNDIKYYTQVTEENKYEKDDEKVEKRSDEEIKEEWKTYKRAKISAEKHDGMSSITSSIVSLLVFGSIFLFKWFLYRKMKKVN